MVGFLAVRDRSVQEFANLLKLKEPTVSHHLAVLREIGLVTARADGTTPGTRSIRKSCVG